MPLRNCAQRIVPLFRLRQIAKPAGKHKKTLVWLVLTKRCFQQVEPVQANKGKAKTGIGWLLPPPAFAVGGNNPSFLRSDIIRRMVYNNFQRIADNVASYHIIRAFDHPD